MTGGGHTSGWSLFILAAIIPGLQLKTKDNRVQSVSYSQAQIYQPVLQPSESTPPTGTYMLKSLTGKPCIRVTMGAEYIVTDKTAWYFSVDPSRIRTTGHCGEEAAVLSLTLPDNAANLQLTFRKEKEVYYIANITADLCPLPVCPGCANKSYSGLLDNGRLFTTANGRIFKCKSETLLLMSSELKLKLVPVKIEAFTVPAGPDGEDVECSADFKKRVVPIVLVATVVGLMLISVLTLLFIRDYHTHGYSRL